MKPVVMNRRGDTENDAVSPVIGVMLMLVVTLVIAAFVSVFAGNALGSAQTAPVSMFEVKILSDGKETPEYTALINLVSGDSIAPEDLRIVTYTKNDDGIVRGYNTLDSFTTDERIIPGTVIKASGNTQITGKSLYSKGQDIAKTKLGTLGTLLGFDLTTKNTKNNFKKYSVVNVEIVHVPSQQTLYSKEVIVQ